MCDFGRIFQKIVRPYVDEEDNTVDEALNTFVRYYEQNELFDHYTHSTGPGLVGVVINMLKKYLGHCVNTKLDRNIPADLNTQSALDVYINKLTKIVNMVVCDPAQGNEVGGKLSKVEEMIKPPKEKKKKKRNVKYTDRKTSSKPSTATVSSDEGSEVSEADTLLSGEEQFSTLTSYDGQKQYRPPDPTKTDAKFGAKKRNPLKSLQEELSKVSKKMTDYQSEINRLNKSLAAQKRKLAEAVSKDGAATVKKDDKKDSGIGKKRLQTYGEWELSAKKGFHPSMKGFMSSQLREDLESNDDIQVIDNTDSTTSGVGKKKCKKRDRDSDEESDDASLVLGRSQVPPKRRRRISSDKSSVAEEVIPSSSQQHGDSDESEGESEGVDRLLRKKYQVEEELKQMKLKMEAMEWDTQARGYRETIEKGVVLFRKALLNNLGNCEESDQLKEMRGNMAHCTGTLAKNGFKLGVCEDFMERVEKTVLSGEIPEQKIDLIKTDHSVDNLVVGFVRDVTYVLTIPAVVKREKGENNDDEDELMIVGVTPATMDPLLIQEVKKEPRSPPPSLNRGQGMKEISEDGSSSQKTVEKAQEDDVTGELPSAEKPEEAELADKEQEGSSSSNSTLQKKQVVCMATATENTNTDTEKVQKKQVMFMATATKNTNTDTEKVTSPEKSTESDASKGKKGKKTLGTPVSKRVLRSKKTK